MNSLNILNDESFTFQFPSIFDCSTVQTYAKRQSEFGQYFSKNKVFINNGDKFNGRYIIEFLKKTRNINDVIKFNDNSIINHDSTFLNKTKINFDSTEIQKIISEIQHEATSTENNNILSSIGLLTNKQYKEFLDQPSNTKKMNYLKKNINGLPMNFKPHLMPLQRPTIKLENIQENDISFKIMTTLFNEKLKKKHHLNNCEIIKHNQIASKLLQNSITIFDITNDSEIEIQQARNSFNYIYNELIKYSDEEIIRLKKNGTIRKFILISTVMTWVKEISNNNSHSEDEEVQTSITQENIFDRLPVTKYQIIFELEKLILKSNASKIKDIFKTYVIGTGIIYGHEENAFHNLFRNAWKNPKEMYLSMLNRMVPVFHVDELAKLVLIVSKYGDCVKDNYILAVEQESYGFNNIIMCVCNELCNSSLVLKEDNLVINQYKFNSFTWDLICSDLVIDPMLDIVVPDYQTQHMPITSNMKKIIHEFIEANSLYSLKLIVSGQPTHVASNIAEHLAQYYKVQLINIPNLINNYLKLLKNNENELKIKMKKFCEKRKNIMYSLTKLFGQSEDQWFDHVDDKFKLDNYSTMEQANEQGIVNRNQMNTKMYKSEYDIFIESSEVYLKINNLEYDNEQYIKNKNDLFEIDKEINLIKYTIENINDRYKKYENNINSNEGQLDNNYLLPLIKESLSSSTCLNQGYVLNIFPLSGEQVKFLYNEDVGYPNYIVLLSHNTNIPYFSKDATCSKIVNENSENLSYYNLEQKTEINDNSDYQMLNKHHQVQHFDFNEIVNETNNIFNNDTVKYKAENINTINKHSYEVTSSNYMENYFSNNGVIILRLNVPLELVNKTNLHNSQYKMFTDTIITQIGQSPFKYNTYITSTDVKQTVPKNKFTTSKTMRNIKYKIALNKLNIMKKEWNSDIDKTQELEKKQEYRKSVKIHNFLSTNILPKLLKEISPIGNEVLQFPEKALNKTKLCCTRVGENYK